MGRGKDWLGILLLAGLSACAESPAAQIEGRLDAALAPAASPPALQQANLVPAPAEKWLAWKVPAGMTDQVFEAALQLGGDKALQFFLVEPRDTPAAAFVDADSSMAIEASERLELQPTAEPGFTRETLLQLPLEDAPFEFFPIRIFYLKHSIERDGQVYSARAVSWNLYAGLPGDLEIGGRSHRFVIEGFLPARLQVNPHQAILGIDSDGNGRIDFAPLSPEWDIARNESVILRAGSSYVSLRQIDPGSRRAYFQSESAGNYRRIELSRGAQVPAFSFRDFDGRQRNLSEFRGNYVLLDFWGSWCGPCLAEFPNLVETYAEFHGRGFEIIGMNADPAPQQLRQGVSAGDLAAGLQNARQTVERFKATWPQARTDSIRDLVLNRFRIYAYPSSILLDPQGRILSTNEADRPLRGPGLRQTLQALLPE